MSSDVSWSDPIFRGAIIVTIAVVGCTVCGGIIRLLYYRLNDRGVPQIPYTN